MGGSVADVKNPADIWNYGGMKCYSVYWVRTRGREVAEAKYRLNKNKNNQMKGRSFYIWEHAGA